MSRFREVFTGKHTLLPVIHVRDRDQALRNTLIAQSAGSSGVFLINHNINWDELMTIAKLVISRFDGFWVGVNVLDISNVQALKIASEVGAQGLWTDSIAVTEHPDVIHKQPEAEKFRNLTLRSNVLHFGGVAFKHQPTVNDEPAMARLATSYMDVVTTSGAATGIAAKLDKITSMKAAIGDFPLALASGITPDNVHLYSQFADVFLVSTGINESFFELDPAKVRALASSLELH